MYKNKSLSVMAIALFLQILPCSSFAEIPVAKIVYHGGQLAAKGYIEWVNLCKNRPWHDACHRKGRYNGKPAIVHPTGNIAVILDQNRSDLDLKKWSSVRVVPANNHTMIRPGTLAISVPDRCRNAPNIIVKASSEFGRNKSWKTCTGYETIFQRDGNFVVYNPSGRAIFNTQTNNTMAKLLSMQADGNLVIYADGGQPLWHSHTNGNTGAFLAIQQDGNVVIYDRHSKAIWSTGTNGK